MTDQGKYRNPAQRVLNLVLQVANQQDGAPASDVWAAILGLDPKKVQSDPHDLNAQLHVIRDEIDLAEQLMRETPFSNHLYAPYLDRVRKAVSLPNLQAAWGNFKPSLAQDTQLALRYCAEILPSEPEVDFEELQVLLDSIQALRKEIDDVSLSSSVKAFLLRQLAILEKAVRDYPIRGGASIKRAFQEGLADLAASSDVVEAAPGNTEVAKVVGLWESLRKVGAGIIEADRIATAYAALIHKGRDVVQAVAGLLS